MLCHSKHPLYCTGTAIHGGCNKEVIFAPVAATFSLNLSASASGVVPASLWSCWHWRGLLAGAAPRRCHVTTARHLLILSILAIRGFGHKCGAARHPSPCPRSTILRSVETHHWTLMLIRGAGGNSQSPLILCAPACNLHIILWNSHKFFALLFPLPFFLLSEMWSSHNPVCFCFSFTEGHIACF